MAIRPLPANPPRALGPRMDEWNVSLAVAAAGVATIAAGVWATRRRRVGLGEVRLLPWNSLMLLGMVAAVFAAAHLLTLWRAQEAAKGTVS